MIKKITTLILVISTTYLTSCGYLSDGPVKGSTVFKSNDQLESCEIQPEKIGQIFIENIEDQIKCLESKLEQFRYVQTKERGILTEGELTKFIKRFFGKNSETIVQGLGLIFELNMLLLRDEAKQISQGNISPLFKLLANVNREAVIITQLIKKMKDERLASDFWKNRRALEASITRFSKEALKIVEIKTKESKAINLKQFILDIQNKLSGKRINEQMIDGLLLVKKILLGGDKNFISSKEVVDLVNKAPNLLMAALDTMLVTSKKFPGKYQYHSFFLGKIEDLESQLYNFSHDETIFNTEDVLNIINQISQDDSEKGQKILKFNDREKIIISLKKNLIGGSSQHFTYKELKTAFTLAKLSIKSLQTYDEYTLLTKKIKSSSFNEALEVRKKVLKLMESLPEELIRLSNKDFTPNITHPLRFIETLTNEADILHLSIEEATSLFSFKQIFLGGKREVLTREELYSSFNKIPQLILSLFDISFFIPKHEDKVALNEGLILQINKIESLVKNNPSSKIVITTEDQNNIISFLFKDDESRDSYKNLLQSYRHHILGSKEGISHNDFLVTMSYATLALDGSNFFLEMKSFFKEKSKYKKKEEFQKVVNLYRKKFNKYLYLKKILDKEINILSFINEASKSLKLDDDTLILIKDLLPIKSLLAGGKVNLLDKQQAITISNKLPQIFNLAYDIFHFDFSNSNKLTANLSIYDFINRIEEVLDLGSDKERIIGVKTILRLAERFTETRFTRFKRTVIDFKERIIDKLSRTKDNYELTYDETNPEYPENHNEIDSFFTREQLSQVINMAKEAYENLIFTDITYTHFQETLKTNKQIETLSFPNLSEYKLLRPESLPSLKENFEAIVKKYRYFRNDQDGMQYYTFEIHRNKFGFEELSFLRWGLSKILLGYGSLGDEDKTLDMDQLSALLVSLRSILEENGLWTSDFKNFARNILLLADLFQSRSTGDMKLNIEEGTEYVAQILAAVKLAKDFQKEMLLHCADEEDKKKVNADCNRNKFSEVLFEKLGHKKYLPQMEKYFSSNSQEKNYDYVKSIEGFARDVPIEEPLALRDFTLILGAMLNIESTFLRFDTDKDNKINKDELDHSLKTYKNVIIMLAPQLEGRYEFLVRTVFFHMIKNQSIPCSTATVLSEYARFWFIHKKTAAKRINIGTLLFYLVNGATCDEDEDGENEDPTFPDDGYDMSSSGKLLDTQGFEITLHTRQKSE